MIRLGVAALLLAIALIWLGDDAMNSFAGDILAIKPLGARWFEIHADSLNLFQAVVQRYIWPGLWDGAVVRVLQSPAWLPFLVVGSVLMIWPRRAP